MKAEVGKDFEGLGVVEEILLDDLDRVHLVLDDGETVNVTAFFETAV